MRLGGEWKKELELSRKLVEQTKEMALPGWTSVPLDGADDAPPAGMPAGLPPLPDVRLLSAEMKAAQARIADLAAQAQVFERDTAIAVETGNADMLLDVRRAREELAVRLWAAQKELAAATLAHLDAERIRVEEYIDHYGYPLDRLRAEIRRLQEQEAPLMRAVAYVESALDVISTRAVRAEKERDRLRGDPTGYATPATAGGAR